MVLHYLLVVTPTLVRTPSLYLLRHQDEDLLRPSQTGHIHIGLLVLKKVYIGQLFRIVPQSPTPRRVISRFFLNGSSFFLFWLLSGNKGARSLLVEYIPS